MTRFGSILLVVDDAARSAGALPRAVDLARESGARLTLVHVFEGYAEDAAGTLAEPDAVELEQIEYETRVGRLETLADEARRAGVEPTVRVLIGTPYLEIVREVLRRGHDLVLRETRGAGPVSRRPLTSDDKHLLRKCPVPVWMVKPTRHRPAGVVLAAVDPAPDDPPRQELNRRVLAHAAAVARTDGATLHVGHVWRLRSEGTMRRMGRALPDAYLDQLLVAERRGHLEQVEALAEPHRAAVLSLRLELTKGDPSTALPAMARQLRADLLVMGSVSRTGVPGLIVGSTAENVMEDVGCAMLVVKPRGFESPVRLPSPEAAARSTA